MITKDKVTEIFCIIDEFEKNLSAELSKNLHLPSPCNDGVRRRNRKGRMSESEIMTILVVFHRVCLRPVCLRSDAAKLIDNFVFHIKKVNFMLYPYEETGSAEEHTVSNMVTPILLARTIRESSLWRLLFCFQAGFSAKKTIPLVRKQSLVAGYVG